MTARYTFGSDEERERYQLDLLASLADRVATLEAGDPATWQTVEGAAVVVLGLTTTSTAITATVNVTVVTDSEAWLVGFMDCQITATGGDEVIGELQVNGVSEPAQIQRSIRSSGRSTPGNGWVVPLAPGTYALRLVARKASSVGAVNIQGQSRLTGIVKPV